MQRTMGMRRRLATALGIGLLCGLAVAAGAQMAPPAPASPALGAQLRPIAAIPAAKLATLRALAVMVMNPERMRQSILAGAQSDAANLQTALQKSGLTPERAQAFIQAFEDELSRRADAALDHDLLVQLLDAAYSDDQATQLLAFYKTPLGSHMLAVEPQITSAYTAHLGQAFSQLGQEVAHDVSGSFPELNKDTAAPAAGELPRPTEVKALYPPVGEAAADLAAAKQRAAANHHHVLVIFGGNWCYDCHVMDAALHSADYAAVMASYETVNINIGDMGKDNLDLAGHLGVDISKGVPALAVLDDSGHVLVAQKQGEFQDTRSLQGSALKAFLVKWSAP